jgi:hypothetical protein
MLPNAACGVPENENGRRELEELLESLAAGLT